VYTEFDGTTWSALTTVGGQITSAPSCTSYAAGQVVCVARDVAGGLTATAYNGTSWGAFTSLSATTTSVPSCAGNSAGDAICAVGTTDSNVLVTRFNGSSWSAFLNLAGVETSNPDCVGADENGEVFCFVRGGDSALYYNVYNGGSWSTASWMKDFSRLGGEISQPSCALTTTGELACAVIGIASPTSGLYANDYNGSSWSGFTLIGSTGIGAPSCASLGTGQVVCAFLGPNNEGQSVTGP
jgi:hypothetical protein